MDFNDLIAIDLLLCEFNAFNNKVNGLYRFSRFPRRCYDFEDLATLPWIFYDLVVFDYILNTLEHLT